MARTIAVMRDDEARSWLDEEAGFGSLRTSKGNLPLAAVDVSAAITGLLAQVTLRQTFVNGHRDPLEATYVFPLPDRAAVTRFSVRVAGREIEGVLKERGEARRDYEVALQQGRRAAIAEEERPNTFTLRVGNLMPGEAATVLLELTAPLSYLDGEATFRFPLVVAPRYVPGAPLPGEQVGDGVARDTDQTPDASRISPPVLLPGFPSPVRLALEATVDPAGLPVGPIRSSLHAVVADEEDGLIRVRVQPGERLNRDFVLRFPVAEKAVRTALAVAPDAEGQESTFALTVVPPSREALVHKPRDVVFVLDHSGSMEGWKMIAARRAVARMVDTLDDHDRFSVLAFDDHVDTVPEFKGTALVPATDRNRFRAVEFLAKVTADGGTELRRPLEVALDVLSDEGARERVVILATDGQVGNEDDILRAVGPRLGTRRVFTVGIDRAVNEGFLKRLAATGGGCCEIVESEDRLDEVMDRIHRRFGTPVLTELAIAAEGLAIDEASLVPARCSTLYAGAPLVLSGRCRGKKGSLRLSGRDAAGRKWTAALEPSQRAAHPAVAAVWARGRVRDLEDQYAITSNSALEEQIVRTSLRFGVLCRFTSFVAVDKAEIANKRGRLEKVTQPVEAPDGWDMLDRALPARSVAPSPAPVQRLFQTAAPPAEPMLECEDAPAMCMDDEAAPEPQPMAKATRSAAPPAPPRPSPSMMPRRMASSGQRREEPAPAAAPGLPLDSFRRRAQEMVEALAKGDRKDAASVVGTVTVQLAALVEDLASVGAPQDVLEPLEKLQRRLRDALDAEDDKKLAGLWDEAAEVLKAFAESKDPGPEEPAGRRRSFWKR